MHGTILNYRRFPRGFSESTPQPENYLRSTTTLHYHNNHWRLALQRQMTLKAKTQGQKATGMEKPKIPDDKLAKHVHELYPKRAFVGSKFVGWTAFADILIGMEVNPNENRQRKIRCKVEQLRKPGHKFSLREPADVEKTMTAELNRTKETICRNQKAAVQAKEGPKKTNDAGQSISSILLGHRLSEMKKQAAQGGNWRSNKSAVSPTMPQSGSANSQGASNTDVESRTSSALQDYVTSGSDSESDSDDESGTVSIQESDDEEPDFSLMDELMPSSNQTSDSDSKLQGPRRDIGHGPLLSQSIVVEHARDLIPQYAFLGCLQDETFAESAAVKVFHNTNVPFSTFVCGVQGSGKSHTTAALLENALIPSKHLGRLRAPASALVFSYSDWADGGVGFEISEATYLAEALPAYPGAHVKRVTVLVSPSNPGIKNCYMGANIRVIPFKLDAKALNISTLLTLMAVNETSNTPLYMARVEAILRSIATNSQDGSMDYKLFKTLLAREKFDPTQRTMLDMRLNLLESFLDLTGQVPDLEYLPGEMTIMDFSDPFVTPNTACILFKLGLDRFVNSSQSTAKVVVLDEAHKYMLDSPGAELLSNRLKTAIRLQRHWGGRVIISTQEPTISTDLIALCSLTVIHRFTSPTWYAALRQHISAMGGDDRAIMRRIEELETGGALVFSPSAVLGKDDEGAPVKATGRLMGLRIRKRITKDGGESIMAV
ncbi:predicted protein [Plenodomus lingam JN3]|uniref:Predicted protein n=1 Tax=Leptosphaeria maculans (strain JN3 / isolate v23.1.3 / race Av1-4-5-6-7-8) TaxID=985895 RepID=E5A9E0_LEPMJ|nr:predicted protein [Plenodomus lingam JN3]CBY00281.1 predicted protein [Plenodomus lingam JN3]